MKKQKTKPKQKHKKSKPEKLFIKKHGIELYNRTLKKFPGIENDPEMFEFINKVAEFYKPPVTARLQSLYDKYFDYPDADADKGGSDG